MDENIQVTASEDGGLTIDLVGGGDDLESLVGDLMSKLNTDAGREEFKSLVSPLR